MSFETNPNWREVGAVAPGDIVHLKFSQSYLYKVKVIVRGVDEEWITGDVDCLFDWYDGSQLTGSSVYAELGPSLRFQPHLIFRVIKERDARS